MVVFGSVFIKEIQRRDRFRARFPVLIFFGKTCSFGGPETGSLGILERVGGGGRSVFSASFLRCN